MTKVMYFKRGLNAKDIDMRFLDDQEHKNHIERFKAAGYLENPPIVCMWNPTTKEQIFCHVEDQKIFELRGFQSTPTWVYHPQEAPKGKIVSAEEAKGMYLNGWYDTPAKFPGNQQGTMKPRSILTLPKEAA